MNSGNQAGRPTELCVLKGARKLISDPAHWTKAAFARSANGEERNCLDGEASCWCAWGALYRAAYDCGDKSLDEVEPARAILARSMDDSIPSFNDNHTHAEVLAAFDRAILAASPEVKEEL